MDYRLLSDEALLKLLKINDEHAFKELYLRYWKRLFYSVFNKINSKEVAEDIVQLLFVELWDKREQHSIENLSGYLETAVKYSVINYIKAAVSKQSHLHVLSEKQEQGESNTDLDLLVKELNTTIDKAIQHLPQKTQTVFHLSRVENYSNKEISDLLDLSEKAVEYHITKSLKTLRIYLKDFMLVDLLIFLLATIF